MHNEDVLLNLIISVKNHSKLYTNLTQNDEDYIREWTDVAKECGMSITEAQDQWNILTTEYMEYLKHNQDFSLARHMDFLQPHFFAINEKETIDEIELLNAIDIKNSEKPYSAYDDQTQLEETELKFCTEMQEEIQIEKVQKTEFQDPLLPKNAESITEGITSASQQGNSISNMSSLELIFLGYAKQLQKMPLSLQLSIKRKIADIMDEAEFQMINL